jgi:hypothetical protein
LSAASSPTWKPLLETRARYELFDTPVARADQDAGYGFGLLRVRAGVQAAWGERVVAHLLLQGAAMSSLPSNAGFGSGPTYLATNGGDRTPSQAGLLEAAVRFQGEGWSLALGRQGFAEGFGTPTGVLFVDGAKRRRLAERLVGNLDFPNVGRRYDGAVLQAGLGGAGRLEAYALRPLAGAFHYDEALEELDVDLFGASFASPFGGWIADTELRFFAIAYRDERGIVERSLGDEIALETLGASWVAGTADWSAVAWGALQRGDYGERDQRAWAAIAEVSRRFATVRGTPSLHLGFETASGGGGTGDRETFFNLLPTNHKFYGSLDYVALANVRDLFLEARWSPKKGIDLALALHDFALADRADAWYGGSGAFSERELGYVARRPADGRFDSKRLGQELDLTASWSLPRDLALKLEAGWFLGGAAAREILRHQEDGGWAALELAWKL